jgi:hypothetical protein
MPSPRPARPRSCSRAVGARREVIAAADEHGLAMVFTGGGISGTRRPGAGPDPGSGSRFGLR